MSLVFKWIESPVGSLKLVGGEAGLAAVLWRKDSPRRVRLSDLTRNDELPLLKDAERQLGAYFDGERKTFDLPLAFAGTPFQVEVWRALLTIPYGETRSYGDIARQIGKPAAVRAVGAANGRNPLSIIAPCHRVIGASGALTGFAGGVEVKRFLLDLERNAVLSPQGKDTAGEKALPRERRELAGLVADRAPAAPAARLPQGRIVV